MPIVILILIILFVCSYLALSINRKAFLDKGTILYSIPLFVIALITYITGYRSLNIGFSFDAFSQCVVAATKIFAFELKTDVAGALYQDNTLFAVCLNTKSPLPSLQVHTSPITAQWNITATVTNCSIG